METEARRALEPGQRHGPMRLAVGVNADSLATWFIGAVAEVVREEGLVLDCVVDDQDHTHALLADGEVLGCVSTRPDPMRGCAAIRLGEMPYLCAASPAFRARWFPRGLSRSALAHAPAIIAPSTSWIYGLALNEGQQIAPKTHEQPGWMLHVWTPQSGFASHFMGL